MAWSATQRERLALEKGILEKYFPNNRVSWNDPLRVNSWVEITMTSNSNKAYKIRVYLASDLPNSCPEMVMVSPKNLKQRTGEALPDTSSEFHTLGMRDGYFKLCHYRPALWTADITLYQVFMKGRLWIAAYEGHLATGKNMDVYLKHMDSSDQSSNHESSGDQISNHGSRTSDTTSSETDQKKKCAIQ